MNLYYDRYSDALICWNLPYPIANSEIGSRLILCCAVFVVCVSLVCMFIIKIPGHSDLLAH